MHTRRALRIAAVGIAAAILVGCSPSLDWREFVPEGGELTVSFPCRPDRQTRGVSLADARLQMTMLSCSAGGATFAVSYVDVDEPVRVSAVLDAWRRIAASNLSAPAPTSGEPASAVRGATPNDRSGRVVIDGRLPDGGVVREHAVFFVRGLRVHAATVIGAAPAPQPVETFFGALRFPG